MTDHNVCFLAGIGDLENVSMIMRYGAVSSM